MIKFIRKPRFTLIEMLVVLFIISLGVVVTGVKIHEMYQQQRYFSESQQILSHLSLAQDLMLIMDTDVQVHFEQISGKKKKLKVWLDIEKPIEERWARLVERKLSLTAIHSLEFNGKVDKTLILQFSLGKMSKGQLILYESEQKKGQDTEPFTINLLGYPSPLRESKESVEKDSNRNEQQLYPAEVYKKLYEDPNNEKKNQKS